MLGAGGLAQVVGDLLSKDPVLSRKKIVNVAILIYISLCM
jgi:hypothetical protein